MAQYGQDPVPQPGMMESGTTPITIEGILDKIADTIITSPHTNISPDLVKQNQKTIRNGIISIGRNNSETLTLFQKDLKANAEDLQTISGGETLTSIVNTISEFGATLESTIVNITPLENGAFSIYLVYTEDFNFDITNILSETSTSDDGTQTILNPLNVSQFINVEQQKTTINPQQANEFLDTNIYELLPDGSPRQDRIDDLFVELNELLPPLPIFDSDGDGLVDREDGLWVGANEYYYNNSISAAQQAPLTDDYTGNIVDENEGYITRLQSNASSFNTGGKTIQELRDKLNDYLLDVDQPLSEPSDDRPEYENQSNGYLQFRNLNQGIIIRNTNQEFIEGLNPNTQDYLQTGFTVTMWVRFLDKVSEGTLFNFGNPLRGQNAFGFKLETYVVDKQDSIVHTDYNNFGELVEGNDYLKDNLQLFNDVDSERFVRLVVNDFGTIRDSHVGNPTMNKLPTGAIPRLNITNDVTHYRKLSTQKIPQDFNEWYFICATFNPNINEDNSYDLTNGNTDFNYNTDFWMNHINPNDPTNLEVNSGLGNKCKVEIISRSDLLRARGFKVD